MNSAAIEKIRLTASPASIYANFSDAPYSAFLDSALSPIRLGQFSFIGIDPFLIFKSKKDLVTLDWISRRETLRGNPFSVLKSLFRRFRVKPEGNMPFLGGGAGYFAYDLKDFNERLPDRAKDDIDIPDSTLCFYDTVLAFDHFRREYFVVSTGLPETGKKALYRRQARKEGLKNRIFASGACEENQKPVRRGNGEKKSMELESNFTKASYIQTVLKAKEYIKRGDIYQVNLSQRFKASVHAEPFKLYGVLRAINPAPFAAFLNFGDVKILSASPERFLRKKGRYVETRPIKGTRPRGKNIREDENIKKELIKSEKDRAENLMIIDLERNDLGRISEYGSVRVSEFMTCEKYASVFHLVSAVEGKLRDKVEAVDCLINCFPGGSITGAPKIRSMEIIEELEPVKRSVYTGSIGYIGFEGGMDTSIVIRTFILKNDTAYFQVGGGIVYDSDPEKEYQETLDKAKALIEALVLSSASRGSKTTEASRSRVNSCL